MQAVEISNLSKIYRGKRGVCVEALRDLSLSIDQGEVFGFLGPNGAGKSTTIKIIMGLVKATHGSTSIMGKDSTVGVAREAVGYLPENPAFYDYLNALEYLRFVGGMFKMPSEPLEPRIEQTLKLLELWDARKRPMRSYSKGMVQRVGLAQVLVHDPDVYILDEPMSGLDPVGRALVKDIILDLRRRGKTVFFSSHIVNDVEKICDRVAIILNGELQCVVRVDQIMSEGVIGYQVRSRRSGRGDSSDYDVSKEELTELLDRLRIEGEEILLVEPRRRHLEDFFLSIVEGKSKI
ncbi:MULTISPECIES: ABC transporter ATP-binding protein [Geobacter]|uniref:ABC transporter ATP-binding protein n=2 Tax=Geobacter TaxID=28231 RepID=A0A0C1QPJ1_9BACT|nr:MULTISPECIES: ABC transporter ATP-binding protein [Geobacter]KIE42512.1 ABC transporter ATP-binding protein [Geobacter soli]MBE2889730.1 ABC transporter ATP-binding protein [Geobacter anodireducens]